jgi:hypothetical protein
MQARLPPPPQEPAPSGGVQGVRVPGRIAPAPCDLPQAQAEALRVQAAAVAAQQAALMDEEARLQQRRLALEQQEAQLAAHLQEKHNELVESRRQLQLARAAFADERLAFDRRAAAATRELKQARAALADNQVEARAERRRLWSLRRRLRQRAHRHWLAERRAMARREEQLADAQAGVARQQAAMAQADRRLHADSEATRRELKAAWDAMRRQHEHWEVERARQAAELQDTASQLAERARGLADGEHALAVERDGWEARRTSLEREVDGLENRVINLRRQVRDREPDGLPSAPLLDDPPGAPSAVAAGAAAPLPHGAGDPERAAPSLAPTCEERLEALDAVAVALADQRTHLALQLERLARCREDWDRQREQAAAELEAAAESVHRRERTLRAAEDALGTRRDELRALRHSLETRQAQFLLRSLAWEADRDRLTIECRNREALADRQLLILDTLRRRWYRQSHDQLTRLRAEYAVCGQLREEAATWKRQYLRRSAALAGQQRRLAAVALALERYRQEFVTQADEPAAAANRLDLLRRRWEDLGATSEQRLLRERFLLEAQVPRLEIRFQELTKQAEAIALREEGLARREAAWDHGRALAEADSDRLRQEVRRLRTEEEASRRQVEQLTHEVERLTHLLTDAADANIPSRARAA